MFKAQQSAAAMALTVGLLTAAPACAFGSYSASYSQRDSRDFERRAYDIGFRSGVDQGEHDARDRRDFRVERSREFRNADEGFRGNGDRDLYRRFFQDGFRSGYADGFNRVTRLERGRFITPVVPYPDGRGSSFASRSGFRDGFEAGRDDARDRDPYDPRRAKRYRDGDHDYNSRYGPRDDYKREYRAAFETGYAQGYRDFRR
jgi:hypothetical protein